MEPAVSPPSCDRVVIGWQVYMEALGAPIMVDLSLNMGYKPRPFPDSAWLPLLYLRPLDGWSGLDNAPGCSMQPYLALSQ